MPVLGKFTSLHDLGNNNWITLYETILILSRVNIKQCRV